MKKKFEQPSKIHTVQACRNLIIPGNLPFFISHETRPANSPGSWCRHTIGMELVVYTSGKGILRTPNIINQMHRGSVCLIPSNSITQHITVENSEISYWNFIFLESRLRIGEIAFTELDGYKRLTEFCGQDESRLSPVLYLDSPLINEIEIMGKDILHNQTFRAKDWKVYCASSFLYLAGRILRECRDNQQCINSFEYRVEQAAEYIDLNP